MSPQGEWTHEWDGESELVLMKTFPAAQLEDEAAILDAVTPAIRDHMDTAMEHFDAPEMDGCTFDLRVSLWQVRPDGDAELWRWGFDELEFPAEETERAGWGGFDEHIVLQALGQDLHRDRVCSRILALRDGDNACVKARVLLYWNPCD